MASILYNANSSLVHRYQKSLNSRSRSSVSIANQGVQNNSSGSNNESNFSNDTAFICQFEKNSSEYLKDLCCSIYPKIIEEKIRCIDEEIPLQIHAFVSLIVKNFIKTWYGVKIKSFDEFFIEIFNIVETLNHFLKSSKIQYMDFLLNDLLNIVSKHLSELKLNLIEYNQLNSKHSNVCFEEYYSAIHNESEEDCTDRINAHLKNLLVAKSQLQNSLLDVIIKDLLIKNVLQKVSEPYLIMRIITTICDDRLKASRPHESEMSIFNEISCYFFNLFSALKKVSLITVSSWGFIRQRQDDNEMKLKITESYLFTFLFLDVLHINYRKPAFYIFGKLIQKIINTYDFLGISINLLFYKYASNHILNEKTVTKIMSMLRKQCFPNDNMLGHSPPIPSKAELAEYETQCIEKLWLLARLYHLHTYFNVDKKDVETAVGRLTIDISINRVLTIKILESFLAHCI